MSNTWIHLVRHGETTGQSSIRYYGRTDVALSDLGRDQIRKLKPVLDSRPIQTVFRSEMLRVRQSTEILLEGRTLQAIAHSPFNEVDFGELEGKTEQEIEQQFPDYWKIWRVEKKALAYPGGETFDGFQKRVTDGAVALEKKHGFRGETLIVAHRGVIRHLLGHFLKLDLQQSRELAPELGQLISLKQQNGGWAIS